MNNPFTLGGKFRMKVFGSSHGKNVGVEIYGCPKGIAIGEKEIQRELDRRKPGTSSIVSQRKEEDRLVVESGIKNGKTTSGKIRMLIENKDADHRAYFGYDVTPRPGHADYPAFVKYGKVESGGGVFSGRMTAAHVMAGALAKKILISRGIRTNAFLKQVGKTVRRKGEMDGKFDARVRAEVLKAMKKNDSVGGIVECNITGVMVGIGEPMFGSVESVISQAVFGIPAVKGIEFGEGFALAGRRGSESNDEMKYDRGKIISRSNNAGGILGGLSNGMPIVFRVAFKPTASIGITQRTVDLKTGKNATISVKGRHDPCVAIRAVPVVENIAAFCIAGLILDAKI